MTSDALTSEGKPARRLLIPVDFRHNHFNTIRMAMALLVIWSHSFAIYLGTEDNEPISLLLAGNYNAGTIAVRVFFIVSGFLITISFIRSKSLLDYLRKRVARIYPGFIVAVLIGAYIVVPLFSTRVEPLAGAIGQTLRSVLVLQAYYPASDVFATHPIRAVNGALWSIPFEFWCYLAVAGLGVVGLLRQRLFVLVALLVIMGTRTWLDLHGLRPGGGIIGDIIGWPYLWFSVAPSFLMGMLAYLYRDLLPRSPLLAAGLLLALIASAHVSPRLCDLLFPPVTAYLTFYLALSPVRLPDAARFGDFSYGTYLYGYPIQQMLIEAHLPFPLYIPAAMLASVAAGIASWFLVERHFLTTRRIKAFTGPAAPAAAGAGRSI